MYSIILVSVLFSFVFALAAVADLPPSESINHATSHGDLRMLTRFKNLLIVSN